MFLTTTTTSDTANPCSTTALAHPLLMVPIHSPSFSSAHTALLQDQAGPGMGEASLTAVTQQGEARRKGVFSSGVSSSFWLILPLHRPLLEGGIECSNRAEGSGCSRYSLGKKSQGECSHGHLRKWHVKTCSLTDQEHCSLPHGAVWGQF